MSNAAAPNDPQRYIGQTLGGRYRVERLLGHGGMGAVYQGTHTTIGGKCAIKILSAACSNNEELRRRFIDEAIAPNKLEHDGVIKVHDVGDTPDGSLFLAMEFLEGQDLEQRLRKTGHMAWPEAYAIIQQLCHTLSVAHNAGIVHRDMKPANCFLVPRSEGGEQVKILDFGIAKLEHDNDAKLTTPGAVMGTPYYMPPEQARGTKVDHRADVYAVGAMLYELLEGQTPYRGDNFADVLVKVVTAPLPAPERAMAQFSAPEQVKDVFERVLAKDPERRYPTMEAFESALDRLDRLSLAAGSGPSGSHHPSAASHGLQQLDDLSAALERATEGAAAFGLAEATDDGLVVALDEPNAPTPVPGADSYAGLATPRVSAHTEPDIGDSSPSTGLHPTGTSLGPQFGPADAPASSMPAAGAYGPPETEDAPLELDYGATTMPSNEPEPSHAGRPRAKQALAALAGLSTLGLIAAIALPSAEHNQAATPASPAPPAAPPQAATPPAADVHKPLHYSEADIQKFPGDATRSFRETGSSAALEALVSACRQRGEACRDLHAVGEINYHGLFGRPRDREQAARLYSLSCDHGFVAACYDAGFAYEFGHGVAADGQMARRYLGKGCMDHDPLACMELGNIYAEGRGAAVDLERAQEYYWQACKDGRGEACLRMGEWLEQGKGGSADDIMAADYYGRACAAEVWVGCSRLAKMHDEGRVAKPSAREARRLRARACKGGHVAACGRGKRK